ncbi:MAG: glycosyltransferase family 39 protein [Planctomycetaceae bacterium]|nr:glycosyltransferase family 39 protein [Planctomycetaceae bacterium]
MDGENLPAKPWWREIQIVWLVVLVVGIYFSRTDDLYLAGEETRRAQVAAEMLWSGDWLVPRQQGKIYLSRPPLGSWAIAIVAQLRGELDVVSVRLPTLLAVLATTLLLYGYTRNFLPREGAFLAAVGYPTMAQVLQLGRVAESEGLFTFFISVSLLVWHWGYLKKWPGWAMWSAGYCLAGLAGLTKGPQGIAYFVGPVWFYLLVIERNWRSLLSPAHLVGLLGGGITIGVWQVPYMMATSWEAGKAVWLTQASNRFQFFDWAGAVKHFVRFPFEILACTFPWSLAFVQVFNRKCWRALGDLRSELQFLLVALAVTFPTVWFAPYARGRYFMPLYPLISIWCGIILSRCASASRETGMNKGWRVFLGGLSTAAVVGGIVVCVIAFHPSWVLENVQIPPIPAALFLGLATAIAIWTVSHIGSSEGRSIQVSTVCIALIMGFIHTGLIVSSQAARQPQVGDLLADVRTELRPDETLVSFGRVSHAFAYYYGKFIPQYDWPATAQDETLPTYFCVRRSDLETHELPFAWEPIAEMSFEDDDTPSARTYVVVGRRLPLIAQKPKPERN